MKKFCSILFILFLAGCTTVVLPSYIPDKNPYKRRFDADFTKTAAATKKALGDLGWKVAEERDPGLYERAWQIRDPKIKHTLMFTDYQKSNYIVNSKNVVLNAYVRSNPNGTTDVELRYLKISSVPYKSFYDYRNDGLIEKVYKTIEELLQ